MISGRSTAGLISSTIKAIRYTALSLIHIFQADPFELRSIRAYEPFDPYRSINWKATAKTGALKVNVYAPTISRKVALLLDTGSNQIWEDADLIEESIRICGSLACALIDAGIPVSLASCGIDCLTGV